MDRLEDHDFFKSIRTSNTDEAKRLMYVGMTRPKEQLILTTLNPGGIYRGNNHAQWLLDIGCDAIDTKSTASVINWGGADWKHSVEPCGVPEQGDAPMATTGFNVIKQPIERSSFDDKFISPSKVKGAKQQYAIEQFATFANRISATVTSGGDDTIGNFIHHVMCLWDGDRSIIGRLANAYGVNVDVENVAVSIEKFWQWMEKTYGKATSIDRELSFSFTNDLGQVVSGEIDLVYHTANGDVLVDYKTYQGSIAHLTDERSDFHAAKYAGQISLYEEALTRGGNVVRDRLICYLSLGTIIRMI